MRELRFRAWLPRRQHFNRCNIHIDGTGLLFWQFGDTCDLIDINERSKILIQQSTGLHDANNKEIYEGDILKHPNEGVKLLKVVFQDGGFVPIPLNEDVRTNPLRLCPDNSLLWDSVIIGNICENQELLKEVI